MGFRGQALIFIAATVLLGESGARRTYIGTVTDNMCGDTHEDMAMGPDPACIQECVRLHGAKYSLLTGKELYTLSDQVAPAKFLARKVAVKGLLNRDTMTLQVESISAAP